jgi:hypothetical protein
MSPTSSSWLNQVERFFALLTERQIRRGIHRSVAALQLAITTFIERHSADPKPSRWTKSADDILANPANLRFGTLGSSQATARYQPETAPITADIPQCTKNPSQAMVRRPPIINGR